MVTTNNVIIADDEAERMTLVTMILYQHSRQIALEKLIDADFYYEPNRRLFKIISMLEREQQDINSVTIRNKALELGWNKHVDDVYIVDLMAYRTTTSNITSLIQLLIDYTKKREMQRLSQKIIDGIQSHRSIDELLVEYDIGIRNIYYDRKSDVKMLKELLPQEIDSMIITNDFIPTQFSDLNFLIKGFRRGDYIICAARTGVGKTAIGLNFACYIAQVHPVLFFSLEMTMTKIRNRIISSLSGVRLNAIEHGGMLPSERERVNAAIDKAKQLQLQFSNKRYLHEIVSIIRRKNNEQQLGLVIIDYVQCIRLLDIKNMQRYQIIGEISSELQALAIEINAPVMVLAQLNRGADDKVEPTLSDLRESGNLEQDARVVMFLHYDKSNKIPGVATYPVDLIVKKNDSGPTGKVNLMYNGSIVTFFGGAQ